MSRLRLSLAVAALALTTGCFQELFAQQLGWQASMYVNDRPRIVAIRNSPPLIQPLDQPQVADALVLVPPGSELESVSLKVCGLGRSVATYIWDLNCFEDPDEVTVLAEGDSFPLQWTPPAQPPIAGCSERTDTGSADTAWDTGWGYYGCSHTLPVLFTAVVDGKEVMAVHHSEWMPVASEQAAPTPAAGDHRHSLSLPAEAAPGELITATFTIDADYRWGTWHWYVDGGTLKDTGVTTGHGFTEPDLLHPDGITTSSNRWALPEEPGSYRIWAVLTGDSWNLDMVWLSATVEVK